MFDDQTLKPHKRYNNTKEANSKQLNGWVEFTKENSALNIYIYLHIFASHYKHMASNLFIIHTQLHICITSSAFVHSHLRSFVMSPKRLR